MVLPSVSALNTVLSLVLCLVQVEELHAQVVEAVKGLYYKHRHLHDWQNRELEIV